jgi:sulfoxide reductase heme-binding subunit YedZ
MNAESAASLPASISTHRRSSAFPLAFLFRRWRWFRILVHVAALVPFALLVWDGAHNQLTVNPIQEVTFRTGRNALKLLLLSLACTPAANLLGFKAAALVRRPLGLYAFFYATLHFLTFTVVDYGLDWRLIEQGIVEKRYVLAGFAAFVLLIPLALTSTKAWQRRLGRRWRMLHWLVYPAAAIAILHFIWLSKGDVLLLKGDIRRPVLYGLTLASLLLLRAPAIRRQAARFYGRRRMARHEAKRVQGAKDSPAPRSGAGVGTPTPRSSAGVATLVQGAEPAGLHLESAGQRVE